MSLRKCLVVLILILGESEVNGGVLYNVTDLGGPSGGFNFATAINNSGQVVGIAGGAFLWDGTMHALGMEWASGINNSGKVAGAGWFSVPYWGSARHAALYDGTVHDLGSLGGWISVAYDINDSGIVVGASDTATYPERHGFFFDGTMHDLGAVRVKGFETTAFRN